MSTNDNISETTGSDLESSTFYTQSEPEPVATTLIQTHPEHQAPLTSEPVTVSGYKEAPTHHGFHDALRSNPLYPSIHELFMWTNPVRSGIVYGIFTLIYLLVWLWDYSFLTLECYTLLALQVLWFAYTILTTKILGSDPLGGRFKNLDFTITEENVRTHVESLTKVWNVLVSRIALVFSFSNPVESIKAAFLFYFLAQVGNWFSDFTLVYLLVTFGFVWPKVYKQKKTEIDGLYHKASVMASEQYDKIKDKIPVEQLKGVLGKKKKSE
eukprot:TRINITY_DN280_c0_g1_i1.p1 TRINITY_DN280_c0_g1~~TRINITY_DN280_c0_g1_i1.p1  ORF type:complete len:269 (-),score=38.24 TRINITY_DN280_c0_g1_i1:75-881(-)